VATQPLAPVIPSCGVQAARQRGRSATVRRLPLACPVPVPSAPVDVVYGIGRIDASGRVADQGVLTAMGWAGGDRLTLTAEAGVVTARRDPGGMVSSRARLPRDSRRAAPPLRPGARRPGAAGRGARR
jgi:hypothetical protein